MTRPSRGISEIQDKARGNSKMATTKAGMFPLQKKDTLKAKVVKRGAPTPDLAQLGAMRGAMPKAPGDMAPSALGMKKGGKCRAAGGIASEMPKANSMGRMNFKEGGRIDGCATKGKTRGKII
jgi:hypothetical protein